MLYLASTLVFAGTNVTWKMRQTVGVGESPHIEVTAHAAGDLNIQLSCAGKSFSLKRSLGGSQKATLLMAGLKAGEHRCTGKLAFEDASSALDFGVSIVEPLTFDIRQGDVDLEAGTVVLHPSRAVTEVKIERIGLGGASLGAVDVNLANPASPMGTWAVTKPVDRAAFLHLDVTARDKNGYGSTLRLTPWFYEIDHEDVEFASGEHALVEEEVRKLEATWAEIEKVWSTYGAEVPMKLYIAGYTDTVGPASSNVTLSRSRARTIAGWYRTRGFDKPIFVQGFGERALLVGTPDETDEPKNRRAAYILAVSPPSGSSFPGAAWSPL